MAALLGVACGSGGGGEPSARERAQPPEVEPTVPESTPATGQPRPGASDPAQAGVALPPGGARFDYQLGRAYPPPAGVSVVARDSSALPEPGAYGICYVNAFQAQPESDWSGARAQLILRDSGGDPVFDPDWPDERVLDISTPERRQALLAIADSWLADCASRGFDAVELDNLDTFERFPERIALRATLDYAAGLLRLAHERALAVAQKNAASESARFRALGFDFAVAEQCWEFEGDCQPLTAEYGERVFDVEYERAAFERGCAARRPPVPILRDRELLAPGPGYLRRECP